MAQLAPLLGQLRLAQTLMMFPLSKISVLVHAECWYRPVSTTGLPTARGAWRVSRRDSGFSMVSDGAKRQLVTGPPTSLLLLEEVPITSTIDAGVKARFWCSLSGAASRLRGRCVDLRERLNQCVP
jgi:hypothetical protein